MSEDLRASMVLSCGLVTQPVVKIEKIISVRGHNGAFVPAVQGKAAIDANTEYSVLFPVFIIDAKNEAEFEKLKEVAVQRVRKSFDAFKERWETRQKEKQQQEAEETPAPALEETPPQ